MTIHVSLPDEFLEYFDNSVDSLETENRVVLAIELMLQDKISISKAAELSNLTFEEFLDELKKRKIRRDPGYGSPEDMEKEMQSLRKMM